MITLAVDTSTMTASCAVAENGKVLSELSVQYGKTHSQKILPMLKEALAITDKSFRDVDLFSAAIGPGSFTGLRIGAVTVKCLGYSLKKPVCGIPTLDALAFSLPDFKGILVPMLDARNDQVFASLYRKMDGRLEQLSPVMGVPIGELIEKLQAGREDLLIAGDAVPLHVSRMIAALGDRITQAQPSIFFPRASTCALLAEQAFRENKAGSAFELEPLYFRKSQAERMKEFSGKD